MKKFLLLILFASCSLFQCAALSIDTDKVTYTVGNGSNKAYIVMQWNQTKCLENLVWGYAFESGKTVADAITDILKADPRFYAVKAPGEYPTGFAFNRFPGCETSFVDAGDNETTSSDGIAEITDGAEVSPVSESAQWASGNWHIFRNGTELSWNDTLAEGDVICLSHNAGCPVEHDYVFYLPSPDENGVWLPSGMRLPIANKNTTFIPILVGLKDVGPSTEFTSMTSAIWRNSSPEATKNGSFRSAITAISSKLSKTDRSSLMSLTFAGTKASENITTYIKVQLSYKLKGESSTTKLVSGDCKALTVAPTVPPERVYFKNPRIENCRLDHEVKLDGELLFEPADATFTDLSYKTSPTSLLSYSSTTGKVKTSTTPGTATLTVTSTYLDEPATAEVTSECVVPVESIVILDDDLENNKTLKLNVTDSKVFGFYEEDMEEDPTVNFYYRILPDDPDCIKYCSLGIKNYNKDTSLAMMQQKKVSHDKWGVVYRYTLITTGKGSGEEIMYAKCENDDTTKGHPFIKEYRVLIGTAGVASAVSDLAEIFYDGTCIVAKGCDGVRFSIYDTSGRKAAGFIPEGDICHYPVSLSAGVYILRSSNGHTLKIAVK